MKKFLLTLLFFISLNSLIFSQVEYIPSDHPVYKLLDKLSIKGIIKDYDDIILPLPEYQVVEFLEYALSSETILSSGESVLVKRYLQRFNDDVSVIWDSPSIIFSDSEKRLYQYNDSLISFSVIPVGDIKTIYSPDEKIQSTLYNIGGLASGSYDGWFGFSVLASNGIVTGNRNAAAFDQRVAGNFTFNDTEINFFDDTRGHLAFTKGIFNLQLGRERILWGASNIERLQLSENPPVFDFVRFSIVYKALRYDYLHGWLVQQPDIIYIDSLIGDVKRTSPKYIASNRIGFKVSSGFDLGISQVIIYSGRPVEAAYLNPFLLWESAQRTLNDLDNSFLTLDARWKIASGIELNFSYLLDDIHFSRLINKGFNTVDNKVALQTGLFFIPSFLPDLSVQLQYSFVRPYTFSHAGIKESLTYTNNGYLLGTPVDPNSVKYSLGLDYLLTADLNFMLNLNYSLHGANEYSSEGHLIRNFGGSVFNNLSLRDPSTAVLLDGIPEKNIRIASSIEWEFIRNYKLSFSHSFSELILPSGIMNDSFFSAQLRLDFQ